MLRSLLTAWLRLILAIVEWLHARTVGPIVDWLDESVLAASEESVKLFVREFFTTAKRLINGFCSHLLGLFDAKYRDSLKLTWQQKELWHSWWREERTSTLNAVLAAQAAPDAAGAGTAGGLNFVVIFPKQYFELSGVLKGGLGRDGCVLLVAVRCTTSRAGYRPSPQQ